MDLEPQRCFCQEEKDIKLLMRHVSLWHSLIY